MRFGWGTNEKKMNKNDKTKRKKNFTNEVPILGDELESFFRAILYTAKFPHKRSRGTDRLTQFSRKKWNGIEPKVRRRISMKERGNWRKKPCLAHFARDQDKIVITDASRTGLGKNLSQKQKHSATRSVAIASRYLNDTR